MSQRTALIASILLTLVLALPAMGIRAAMVNDAADAKRALRVVVTGAENDDELEKELRAMIGDIDVMSRSVNELLRPSRVDNPDYAVAIGGMSLQPEIDRVCRADRARTRSSGTSLGLPIARGVVTLPGGTDRAREHPRTWRHRARECVAGGKLSRCPGPGLGLNGREFTGIPYTLHS